MSMFPLSLLEGLSTSSSNSQTTKLALVGFAASISTAAVILSFQGSQRKRRVRTLKDELRKSLPPPVFDTTLTPHSHDIIAGVPYQSLHQQQLRQQLIQDESFAFDEDLIREQMQKNIEFFGEEGFDKLRNSFVIIVGAGRREGGDTVDMAVDEGTWNHPDYRYGITADMVLSLHILDRTTFA
jgi:hypothetical protein